MDGSLGAVLSLALFRFLAFGLDRCTNVEVEIVLVVLVNLAERLLNQNSTESQQSQVPRKKAAVHTNPTTHAVAEDQFTPSPQDGQAQNSAQDAGLFSVAQISFFSAAAEFLLGQTTAPTADQTTPG